jgi:hypothetical protein
MNTFTKIALGVAAWETFWWMRRRSVRRDAYLYSLQFARTIGKPLVVVGAPDMGMTQGPGCGDITVDLGKSACPNFIQADITKNIPLADDSAVVLVLCTLEYVNDYPAAMRELKRVAGKNLFVVRVEPWTLAAYLYPGRQRVLPVKA